MNFKLNSTSKGILQVIAIVFAILLLSYFIYKIRVILFYVLISGVVSLVGTPIVNFLKTKFKLSNTLSVIITMLAIISILMSIFYMTIPVFTGQIKNISLIETDIYKHKLQQWLIELNQILKNYNISILKYIKNINLDFLKNIKYLPDFLNSAIGILGNIVLGTFTVLFVSFFFLKDTNKAIEPIYELFPSKYKDKIDNSLRKIRTLLSSYFIGIFAQITILFILYSTLLYFLGISHPFVIAMMCALVNVIPYIGPIIGFVFMSLYSTTDNISLSFANEIAPILIYIVIFYTLIQLIDNFLIQPIIFSKSINSHPLEIFIIILIGGTLFGILGMVIAVPTYTTIKVISKEFLSEFKIIRYLSKNI